MERPLEFDKVRAVDIEPASGCTRRCGFCDPGVPRIRRTNPTFIDLDKLSQVCSELKSWNYSDNMYLAGHGEPMMHPDIGKVISICKTVGVRVGMFTNGDLLTPDRYHELKDLDTILYDQYSKIDHKLDVLRQSVLADKIVLREQWRPEIQQRFNSRCGAVWTPTPEQLERVRYIGCECIQSKICLASDGTWYCCCMDIRHTHKWQGGLYDLFNNSEYMEMRKHLRLGHPHTPRLDLYPCRFCETTDT